MVGLQAAGHTAGSACLVLQHEGQNILFSGDTAAFNGRLGWMGNPYASFEQYLQSADKLRRLIVEGRPVAVDAILPGHGTIVMSEGSAHLNWLHESLRWVIGERSRGNNVTNVNYWERSWTRYRDRLRGKD